MVRVGDRQYTFSFRDNPMLVPFAYSALRARSTAVARRYAAAAWPGRYSRVTRASTAIASSGRAEIGLRSTSCARCKNYCRHRPRPGRFAALCALRSRRRDRRQCSWRHTHGIGRIGIEHTAIVIAGPGACGMRASSVRRRPGLRQRGIAGNVSTGDFDRHADPDSKDES